MTTKSILKNSFSTTLGFCITAVVTFFITPFIIHRLGNELYGVWTLLTGLTGYLGLLDFGMRTAIVKYVSEYNAKGDYEKLNGMGSTARTLFTFMGLFCWLLAVIFSLFIQDIFNLDTATQVNYFLLLFIIGGDIFLTFSFMIYQGSLGGFQRYDISVRNGIIAFSIKNILVVVLLSYGYSVVTLSVIVLVSNLFGFILNFISTHSICHKLKYSIGRIDNDHLRNLWGYSWKSFVTNISDRLIYYSDSIIIGIFLTPEHITFYTIASTLIIYLRQLVLSAGGVIVPAISSEGAKNDISSIHQIVLQGSKLILFILIPISCALMIVGKDFILLWIGPGYEKSYQVLTILLASQFIVLSQYGVTLVLYGLGKHDILAKINIVVAVANVVLSVILVHYWGIIGVALGSAIPICLLRIILIPRRVFKIIKMNFTLFLKEIVWPNILIIILYSLFLFGLTQGIKINSWVNFSLNIGISLIGYFILYYFIGLKKNEREKIKVFLLLQIQNIISIFKGA